MFGLSKFAAWQKLRTLRILPGDSVDPLANEINDMLRAAIGIEEPPDELVAHYVIDALLSVLAEPVTMLHRDLTAIILSVKSLISGRPHVEELGAAAKLRFHRTPPNPACPRIEVQRAVLGVPEVGPRLPKLSRTEPSVRAYRCNSPLTAFPAASQSGKRHRAFLGSRHPRDTGLIQTMRVDGRPVQVLIDTGCSVTLVSERAISRARDDCLLPYAAHDE